MIERMPLRRRTAQAIASDQQQRMSTRTSVLLGLSVVYDDPVDGWKKVPDMLRSIGQSPSTDNLVQSFRELTLVDGPPGRYANLRPTDLGLATLVTSLERSALAFRVLSALETTDEELPKTATREMLRTQNRIRTLAALTREDGPRTALELSKALNVRLGQMKDDIARLAANGCLELVTDDPVEALKQWELTSPARSQAHRFAQHWTDTLDRVVRATLTRLPTNLLRPDWREETRRVMANEHPMTFGIFRTLYTLASRGGVARVRDIANDCGVSDDVAGHRLRNLHRNLLVKRSDTLNTHEVVWSLSSQGTKELTDLLPAVRSHLYGYPAELAVLGDEEVTERLDAMSIGSTVLTGIVAERAELGGMSPAGLRNKARFMDRRRLDSTVARWRQNEWLKPGASLKFEGRVEQGVQAFIAREGPVVQKACEHIGLPLLSEAVPEIIRPNGTPRHGVAYTAPTTDNPPLSAGLRVTSRRGLRQALYLEGPKPSKPAGERPSPVPSLLSRSGERDTSTQADTVDAEPRVDPSAPQQPQHEPTVESQGPELQ